MEFVAESEQFNLPLKTQTSVAAKTSPGPVLVLEIAAPMSQPDKVWRVWIICRQSDRVAVGLTQLASKAEN